MTLQRVLELAKISPALFTPVIIGLDGYTERYAILKELIQHWVRIDLRTTWVLVKKLHAETLDDQLLTACLTATSEIYPLESLEFTHDFLRDFGSAVEASVYSAIVDSDLDVAKELLSQVRSSYDHPRPFTLNGALEKLGPEYVIEFGLSLSPDESKRFFRGFSNFICIVEPQVFIDVLDNIQAPEAVSKIARCILLEASLDEKLTVDQFEILYGKLLDQDLRSIDEYEKTYFIRGEAR